MPKTSYFLPVFVWIFVLEYVLFFVGSNKLDIFIKVVSLVLLVVLCRPQSTSMRQDEKVLALLFAAWLVYPLFPAILQGDRQGCIQWAKLVVMSSIMIVLMAANRDAGGILRSTILQGYKWLGLGFAIQALGGVVVVYLGLVRGDWTNLVRRPAVPMLDLGVWGYGNAIQYPIEGVAYLRPQGWFLEPSLLAAFLIPSFVFFLGAYLESRRVLEAVGCLVTGGALLCTLSLAGVFGLVLVLLFAFLAPILYRRFRGNLFREVLVPTVISVLFILITKGVLVGLNSFRNAINSSSPLLEVGGRLLGRDVSGPSGNLIREYSVLNSYMDVLAAHPFGIGLGHTSGTWSLQTANAAIFWLMTSGVGFVFPVLFFAYLYFKICSPQFKRERLSDRLPAACVLGIAAHNLSYGNWVSPSLLILIVLVMLLHRVQSCETGGVAPGQNACS